mmetsp:Transcript_49089/g.110427  ORF Transcript_49089/g.110427 Transcript_49089/m.110427 type:complete len:210 (+) Transcript_49089:2083-2712(+)
MCSHACWGVRMDARLRARFGARLSTCLHWHGVSLYPGNGTLCAIAGVLGIGRIHVVHALLPSHGGSRRTAATVPAAAACGSTPSGQSAVAAWAQRPSWSGPCLWCLTVILLGARRDAHQYTVGCAGAGARWGTGASAPNSSTGGDCRHCSSRRRALDHCHCLVQLATRSVRCSGGRTGSVSWRWRHRRTLESSVMPLTAGAGLTTGRAV